MSTPTVGRARVLRVYDVVRSAHLERDMVPGDLVYRSANYDFDPTLAAASSARRLGRFGIARAVFAHRNGVVEINEPAMVRAWPTTLAVTLTAKISNLFRRGRIELVSYAIENADIAAALSSRLRLPIRVSAILARAVVAPLFRSLDRCAFGTPGSRQTYRDLLGEVDGRSAVFPALPSRCPCLLGLVPVKRPVVVFLGDFSERKGISELMTAWSTAGAPVATHALCLMGKGELTEQVLGWAETRAEVEVVVDPSREEIHQRLAEAAVLVLLSQPHPRWREQVGLPILEALAHGCAIVASTETGVAPWLSEHGHRVIDPGAAAQAVAESLSAAATGPARTAEILQSLPLLDGRIAADHWLVTGSRDPLPLPSIDCEAN